MEPHERLVGPGHLMWTLLLSKRERREISEGSGDTGVTIAGRGRHRRDVAGVMGGVVAGASGWCRGRHRDRDTSVISGVAGVTGRWCRGCHQAVAVRGGGAGAALDLEEAPLLEAADVAEDLAPAEARVRGESLRGGPAPAGVVGVIGQGEEDEQFPAARGGAGPDRPGRGQAHR